MRDAGNVDDGLPSRPGGVDDDPDSLLRAGDHALFDSGELVASRYWYGLAAEHADASDDGVALARAALGLGGLWVHEHRSAVQSATVSAWQRRALGRLDRTSSLAARLRARMTAEADYRAGTSQAIRAVVTEARARDDPVFLADALSLAHHCLLGPEHATTRLALAEELLEVGVISQRSTDTLMGLLWRTVDLFLAGDPHAERSLTELRTLTEHRGHAAVAYVVAAMDVMLCVRRGEFEPAERLAEACAERGREVGDADAEGWYGAHICAIRWFQGRSAELMPLLAQVVSSPTLAEPNDAYFAALAVSAVGAGDPVAASGALRRLRGQGLGRLRPSSTWLVSLMGAIEAAALLDDRETAAEAYDLLLPHADVPVMASLAVVCFGSAQQTLGVAALTLGKPDCAVDHLQAAVRADEALGNWPARARASERLREAEARLRAAPRSPPPPSPVVCRRRGRCWEVTFGGRTAVVTDRVGMRYLATLLANPGVDIAATELAGSTVHPDAAAPLIDETARQKYRHRLDELRSEIDEAADAQATERAERARVEFDWVASELAETTGLHGQTRRFADDGERARTAVQKALRRALARIRDVDPVIGQELSSSIVTGRWCCYHLPARAAESGAPAPTPGTRWHGDGTP